jgi:hypothetical protein
LTSGDTRHFTVLEKNCPFLIRRGRSTADSESFTHIGYGDEAMQAGMPAPQSVQNPLFTSARRPSIVRNHAFCTESLPIAIADQQQAQGHNGPVKFWPQVALAGRAIACEQNGDFDGARRAIERLKVEYPKSNYTQRVIDVQARVEGRAPEAVRSYEAQALQLAEQVSALVKAGQKSEALALVDQIVTEYPGTAGSCGRPVSGCLAGFAPPFQRSGGAKTPRPDGSR